MIARYEFEVDDNFKKGDCWHCPLCINVEDIEGYFDDQCVMGIGNDCPLELIDEKLIDKINAVGLINPIGVDELKAALEK